MPVLHLRSWALCTSYTGKPSSPVWIETTVNSTRPFLASSYCSRDVLLPTTANSTAMGVANAVHFEQHFLPRLNCTLERNKTLEQVKREVTVHTGAQYRPAVRSWWGRTGTHSSKKPHHASAALRGCCPMAKDHVFLRGAGQEHVWALLWGLWPLQSP